jgi:hypothetical protein
VQKQEGAVDLQGFCTIQANQFGAEGAPHDMQLADDAKEM